MWGRRPKLMLFGAIPALLAALLLLGALIGLGFGITDLTDWMTGFAESWPQWLETTIQVFAGVVIFALAIWLSILVFTTLTLLIGDPFYEKIAEAVDDELGGAPVVERGIWKAISISLRDNLRMLGKSIVIGVLLFALGFVPVVGTVLAIIIGALVGGWFLSVELSGYAFQRRGHRYPQYRRMLGRRRGLAIGLGTCVFLLFLIPLGAVLVMPAAVAGSTLLARDVLGENVQRPAQQPTHVPPPSNFYPPQR
ncbi:protein of unknown function DUF540 [Stackebrandtia nassauensis DSM 44728]|uniref:CysZ protein n=2 Tax=Stackebrandtia TaxID=283810 RepID=D3PY71_STANL|nr:protein of unknown function DUF540 [Stackebrandtia nassauensis DSM 44728]